MSTLILARPTLGQRLAGPLTAAGSFLRLLATRPVGLVGFIGIVFFLLLAFVAPVFVPLTNDPSLLEIYETPSVAHPLGTDFQRSSRSPSARSRRRSAAVLTPSSSR